MVMHMKLLGSKKIETKRLILRKSSMKEQKRLWEILMIPEVNKWYLTSAKKHACDKEYWLWECQKKFYQMKVDCADNNDVFCWSIFIKKEFSNSGKEEVIGQISSPMLEDDNKFRDIGWYINPEYQRIGLAFEAASEVVKYLFEDIKISAIISSAVKDNFGSCRLFEKLGFIKTGEVKKKSPYTFYEGELVFSLYELNEEIYNENN